jgi:hypothetical protein
VSAAVAAPGAAAVAVAVALAGCGGGTSESEKERYEKEFTGVMKRAETRGKSISQGLDSLSDTDVPGSLRALERVRVFMNGVADELARVKPPADVRAAHRSYVAGLREFANRRLTAMAQTIRRLGPRKAMRQPEPPTPQDVALAQRLQQARERFKEEGYDLGLEEEGLVP